MSAHTPGPWKVTEERGDDGVQITLYGQRQWVHAIGQPWVPYRLAVLDCDAVRDPDARLMAAAPELLEALRLVQEAMTVLRPQCTEGADVADVLDSFIPAVRAAIAKAEGRAT